MNQKTRRKKKDRRREPEMPYAQVNVLLLYLDSHINAGTSNAAAATSSHGDARQIYGAL